MDATARTQSAADRVYLQVREAILDRRLADNDLLAEGRIAQETGVSRTPVREALLRLESEGMVRLLPKRGALVLPVTAREWRDVLATRRLIETHCLREVMEAGQGQMLASKLAGPLAEQQASADAADLRGFVAADREFHARIVAAAGNQILVKLYCSLRDRQLRMGAVNLLEPDGGLALERVRASLAEHREIADAIGRADLDAVLQLMTSHLDGTAARLS